MLVRSIGYVGVLMSITAALHAEERLPAIPPAQYTTEQKHAAAEFEAARKTPVFGPFEPLMYSPELMSDARAMGDYLRYKSAIGNTLSEFTILLTASEWAQDYEWSVHYPIAIKAGIPQEIADAVGAKQKPAKMNSEQELVYQFATELLRTKHVDDATFAKAKARFGNQGVVDLAGIVGYYTLLAMQLNMAQYPVPKGGATLPKGSVK